MKGKRRGGWGGIEGGWKGKEGKGGMKGGMKGDGGKRGAEREGIMGRGEEKGRLSQVHTPYIACLL